MAKCFVCESLLQKKWRHCPECGIDISESALTREGYSIERIQDTWTLKGGSEFCKNFTAMEYLAALPFTKVKPIRPVLGDFLGIHFANLKIIALLSLQPECITEVMDMYRLQGYISVDYAMKTLKLSRMVDVISKTRFFWRIVGNKEFQNAFYTAYERVHQAIVKIEGIDEKKREVVLSIEEDELFYLKVPNFIELPIIEGHIEALCDMKCVGEEERHDGKKYFVYTLYPKEEKVEYHTINTKRGEYNRLVDELVDYIVYNKPSGRKKLEDKVHISGEQCENYFILKSSEGHRVLEKYSGVHCGRKLAEKAVVEGEDKAYEFARKIFKQEMVGLLQQPAGKGEHTTIRMDESFYASGVKNIHMKQCTFLAGMIEGILSQSTNQKWLVDETKCLADGDDYCEFKCKTR